MNIIYIIFLFIIYNQFSNSTKLNYFLILFKNIFHNYNMALIKNNKKKTVKEEDSSDEDSVNCKIILHDDSDSDSDYDTEDAEIENCESSSDEELKHLNIK